MYQTNATIKLPDTDAAGILFYANYFKLAHEVYESFMEEINFGLDYVLGEADFLLLIANAECEYHRSLTLGEKYTVELEVKKIGRTSYVLAYNFLSDSGDARATVTTVHVAVAKDSKKPIALPEKLRTALEQHT